MNSSQPKEVCRRIRFVVFESASRRQVRAPLRSQPAALHRASGREPSPRPAEVEEGARRRVRRCQIQVGGFTPHSLRRRHALFFAFSRNEVVAEIRSLEQSIAAVRTELAFVTEAATAESPANELTDEERSKVASIFTLPRAVLMERHSGRIRECGEAVRDVCNRAVPRAGEAAQRNES